MFAFPTVQRAAAQRPLAVAGAIACRSVCSPISISPSPSASLSSSLAGCQWRSFSSVRSKQHLKQQLQSRKFVSLAHVVVSKTSVTSFAHSPAAAGAGLWAQPRRSLFIQTESTPNPNSLKFVPGKPVLPADSAAVTMNFPDFRTAQQQSPLAAKLFSVDGVSTVFFGRDYIAVNIAEGHDWSDAKPAIFGVITDFYASEEPVLRSDSHHLSDADRANTRILETDDEPTALIKELLESRIRPAIQEDGGDLVFKKFDPETGLVWLQLQGSCVGCPSSAGTLKHGIQNMLMHYVEEVKGVEEWIDEELEAVSQEQLAKLEQRLSGINKSEAEN